MARATDIKRLEYPAGQTPRREFKPDAPGAGVLLFQRLGDPPEPVVTVIELDGRAGEATRLPHPIVYHSPTGLEWGFAGSGPADLAANVLALFLDLPEAWRLHQWFKFDCIAPLDQAGDRLEIADVRRWIVDYWRRETDNPERIEREAEERRLWAEATAGDDELDQVGEQPPEVLGGAP